MSIDRIDSSGVYSLENCRLVTAAVNFSKGDQCIELFHVQKLMYFAKLGGKIDDKLVSSKPNNDPNSWEF